MATIIQEHIALSQGLNTATAELAARLRASTVEVRSEGHGNGSGVIWRTDGLIITNAHVVRTDRVEVVLADGRSLPARVASVDPEYDLAALHVAATDLQAASIGDSAALRVGQFVLAMGNPMGVRGALTVGIVHMVARQDGRDRWLRADLSLAPGNSGGPMTDAQGRVVGINSMVAGGLALAVPSNVVERFLKGQTKPSFLGVQTQVVALPNGVGDGKTTQERGLLVLSVVECGPAARNGLLPGDLLLAAGGRALHGPDDLLAVLRESAVGTPLPLTIVRAGRQQEVTAILGERESEAR